MLACLWQHDRRKAHETDDKYQAKEAQMTVVYDDRSCITPVDAC